MCLTSMLICLAIAFSFKRISIEIYFYPIRDLIKNFYIFCK